MWSTKGQLWTREESDIYIGIVICCTFLFMFVLACHITVICFFIFDVSTRLVSE